LCMHCVVSRFHLVKLSFDILMKIHETTFMKVLHTMDQLQCDGAWGWGEGESFY
jgi:hypothetical protein